MPAALVFRNAFVWIQGTDLSAYIREVRLNYASEMLDATVMGDDTRRRKGGMKDWSFDFTVNEDYAAGSPERTLFSVVGTTACVEVRPQNICASQNNPSYSGIGTVENFPLGGAVGTLLQPAFRIQSFTSLTRASSS